MGAPLAPGTVLHGRYTVTMLLRSGPAGALYQGTDVLAAAKILVIYEAADPSPDAQARFEQEARLLSGLEHPSLPVVLDSFAEPSGRQYLVLLGFEEPSLAEALAGGRSFAEGDVLPWFARLVAAVEHLHSQNPSVIHGGISPANIVITADGTPHLMGLVELEVARAPDSAEAGAVFRAPEQDEGWADERTDVYGLGATLYALLTGHAPASAGARAAGKELVPPREFNKGISPHVEAAILKAMALDPAQRLADVAQLWQALTQPGLLAGEGDRAVARPRVAKQRPPRRARALLVGGGGGLALVAAALLAWRLLPLGQAEVVPPSPTAAQAAARTAVQPLSVPTATMGVPAAEPATSVPTPEPATEVAVTQPAPSPTPRPAATRWFAGPSASATPRWFPPPVAMSPAEGAVITGAVEFRWSWPYELAEDEYFDLQVYRYSTEPRGIAWCKEPHYTAQSMLAGKGRYEWRVRVIHGRDGQVEGVVSDPSPTRILDWRPESE